MAFSKEVKAKLTGLPVDAVQVTVNPFRNLDPGLKPVYNRPVRVSFEDRLRRSGFIK